MANYCPICGPKYSICAAIISVWGIIFLTLMGVFFHVRAGILFPDLAANLPDQGIGEGGKINSTVVEDAYDSMAQNCWIAAALYFALLLFSLWQYRWGSRPASTPSNYRAFQ